jgi:hypothetical protein
VRNAHSRTSLADNMGGLADLEEWRTYPHNLPAQGCNAYGYDFDAYAEKLDEDSERLFESGPNIYIKIVEFNSQGKSSKRCCIIVTSC